MSVTILHNATIITSEKETTGSIVIREEMIEEVLFSDTADYELQMKRIIGRYPDAEIISLEGKCLMAGGIDAHVHFREPGLTHKADIASESLAAAAGGVTSVIDMPNTSPATTTVAELKNKLKLAEDRSFVNIGFHIGATNTNIDEMTRISGSGQDDESSMAGGIKVFMGSSTGNMLVDDKKSLEEIFSISGRPVLVHCEDEKTIRNNLEKARESFGEDIPFKEHENIRSRKACIISSIAALEMAIRHKTSLVLCHISTKEEIEMVRAAKTNNPSIVAETSCNYLWFCNEDYSRLGSRLKCNPSVKALEDRTALREALANGIIDTIGSDHAPHLPEEKDRKYLDAPSGLPSIQQSLPVLITIAEEENIPLSRIAAVFSENAADIYGLDRGKLLPGYHADIVIFDKDRSFTVRNEDQLSKCGWSPYEGTTLKGLIETVIINGRTVIREGKPDTRHHEGQVLRFGYNSNK